MASHRGRSGPRLRTGQTSIKVGRMIYRLGHFRSCLRDLADVKRLHQAVRNGQCPCCQRKHNQSIVVENHKIQCGLREKCSQGTHGTFIERSLEMTRNSPVGKVKEHSRQKAHGMQSREGRRTQASGHMREARESGQADQNRVNKGAYIMLGS